MRFDTMRLRGSGRVMLLAGLLAFAGPAAVAGGDRHHGYRLSAQDRIEDLAVCYARGTDAIGRAVDAIGGQPLDSTVNLANPEFAEGLAYYRRCFDDGFSFTLLFNGEPALTVPDPATRSRDTDAALQWANFVNNAFREPGYSNTQHHMGSISSTVRGGKGTATSYLIATHVFGPTSANTGINIVNGTYDDVVVRRKGRWFIQERHLNIISSVLVPQVL